MSRTNESKVPVHTTNSVVKMQIKQILESYLHKYEIENCLNQIMDVISRSGTIKFEASNTKEPDFIPKDFTYFDGAISTKNYRIINKYKDIFTWVPGRTLENGTVVNGFYVSSYEISQTTVLKDKYSKDAGILQSLEGTIPLTCTPAWEFRCKRRHFHGTLISNDQYDAICEMFAEEVGYVAVYKDSTNIGNYSKKYTKTGAHVICGISNMTGNTYTITNDTNAEGNIIVRGGSYIDNGYRYPMAHTSSIEPDFCTKLHGFRMVISQE